MKKIRVLHFVSSIGRDGGVMNVIMNLYRNINRDKIQFDFVYFDEIKSSFEEEILSYGGRCFKVSRPSLNNIFKFKRELEKILKDNKEIYKIIHIHEVYLTNFIYYIAKKNEVNNIITHSHTTMYSDKKSNSIRNRMLCWGLKRHSNNYYACSNAAGKFLYGEKYMKAGKVNVINNAIDCEKYKYKEDVRNSIRKEMNLENKFVIGHVGRFNEQKNHSYLIDIFYEIKKIKNNAYLMLVGDGPLVKDMKNKVKELELTESVGFLGKRIDVSELLQVMDVFVLPSLYEGLPVIGVEAQASGLPCIISDEVTKEIDITGIKFKSLRESPQKWAKEIIEFENGFVRKNTTRIIKEKGFDIQVEAKKTEKLYLKIINKKRMS